MKKALSVFLAVVMLLSSMSVSAFAAETASDANNKVEVSIATDVTQLPTVKVVVSLSPREGKLVGANLNLLYNSELVEWKMDHSDAYYERVEDTKEYYGVSFSQVMGYNDDDEYIEKKFKPAQISANQLTIGNEQSASIIFSGNQKTGITIANSSNGVFSVTYYFNAKDTALVDGGDAVFTLLTGGTVSGKDAFAYNAVNSGANISVTALTEATPIIMYWNSTLTEPERRPVM